MENEKKFKSMAITLGVICIVLFTIVLLNLNAILGNIILQTLSNPLINNHSKAAVYDYINSFKYNRYNSGFGYRYSNHSNSNEDVFTPMRFRGNIHVVAVHTGNYRNSSNQEMGDVNVKVNIPGRPVTLLLCAHEPVKWHIKYTNGTKIKEVITAGAYKQEVAGWFKPFKVEEFKRNIDLNLDTKDDYLDTTEELQNLLGSKPESIQYTHNGKEFLVDGHSTKTINDFPSPINPTGPVTFVCVDGDNKSCKISKDGLTVASEGISQKTYRANKCYSRGKLYFEATLHTSSKNKHPYSSTMIGVTTPKDASYTSPYDDANTLYGFPRHRTNMRLYYFDIHNQSINNDTIGIAIDFANNNLYYSVNGKWVNGNPLRIKSGRSIKANRDYYAAVSFGRQYGQALSNDSWTANFGEKPFKYQIPQGYLPYNAGK